MELSGEDIKNMLKDHLKIKIDYKNPMSMFDGQIRATLLWDNDIIDMNAQPIKQSYF